jgi:uncharacterized membrane protein YfcA
MIDFLSILILIFTGLIVGFLNTVAGGGSLISLPILIFMGLPSNVANASSRIGILFQSASAVKGFQSKNISTYPYNLFLGISALLGALLGAKIAVDIKGETFNKILAIVMILLVFSIIFKPSNKTQLLAEKMSLKYQFIGTLLFFFVGIYGGFIQAGVGFIMIVILTSLNKFTLVKSNSAKSFVILVYTCAAIIVFAYEGIINWPYGLTLAVGNAIGGWFASRWSVVKGDEWIKSFLLITVIALAIKLWFF